MTEPGESHGTLTRHIDGLWVVAEILLCLIVELVQCRVKEGVGGCIWSRRYGKDVGHFERKEENEGEREATWVFPVSFLDTSHPRGRYRLAEFIGICHSGDVGRVQHRQCPCATRVRRLRQY